jgi:hypothetical protein
MQQQNQKKKISLCLGENLHQKNNKIEEEKSRKWKTGKKMLNKFFFKVLPKNYKELESLRTKMESHKKMKK